MALRNKLTIALSLVVGFSAVLISLALSLRVVSAQEGTKQPLRIGATAIQQIEQLMKEKRSLTANKRKIASSLLFAIDSKSGKAAANGLPIMRSSAIVTDKDGMVLVDIKAEVTKDLLHLIEKLGGTAIYLSKEYKTVRARMPLSNIENLANVNDVKSIGPAAKAMTVRQLESSMPEHQARIGLPYFPGYIPSSVSLSQALARAQAKAPLSPGFAARAVRVREKLERAIPAVISKKKNDAGHGTPAGLNTSALSTSSSGSIETEGVVAHRVNDARNFFGANGAGVKIGVISDSVDFLAQVQASGDLPADVTVLAGQGGPPSTSEGTALLEIIHDIAPAAKLFFATAFISEASFADNIRALRAAGCDIIVDDIIYFDEPPFQDGIVAQAVNDVTNDGALYFSSAGNTGNFNDGTSSVCEIDFKDGGEFALLPGGQVLDFGDGNISNRVESSSPAVLGLFWSDPLGASNNDYDLFVLNSTLTTILDASTDFQNGDDDPVEIVNGAFTGERVVVWKSSDALPRAIHLDNFGGQLAISTPGSTHGHSSSAAAFGVAAVDVVTANRGPFTGGPTEPVELFSSDGPRRIFFKSDGTPITPDNFLFNTGGGELRSLPTITAADGTAAATPGFNPFFGTSAAAPHAAAIAALLRAAKPTASTSHIRNALTQTALDIEARRNDRDSGFGIIDAFSALQFIGATPMPFLELGTVTPTVTGGDGDAFLEPSESASLSIQLINIGGATALGVHATLTTSTPNVAITSATSSYPNIASVGGITVNDTPFMLSLTEGASCGLPIELSLNVTYTNGESSPQTFTTTLPTGQPGSNTTFSYAGPPVAIPDNNASGVDIPITVSGIGGIADINFSFDGDSCTTVEGATSVGLDHTFVGDLVITLTSPQGTTITLMNQPGGALNGGNNFCHTVFDDEGGGPSIQTILSSGPPPLGPPYSGIFNPFNPLAIFRGENPNGTWILNVSDRAAVDIGAVRAFSLVIASLSCN